MKKTRYEGYWSSKQEPDFPTPVHNDKPFLDKDLIVKKIISVQSRLGQRHYKGFSKCRCCGAINGSGEYSHKGWIWPEGFLHYIIEHNIEPTEEFKKYILNI